MLRLTSFKEVLVAHSFTYSLSVKGQLSRSVRWLNMHVVHICTAPAAAWGAYGRHMHACQGLQLLIGSQAGTVCTANPVCCNRSKLHMDIYEGKFHTQYIQRQISHPVARLVMIMHAQHSGFKFRNPECCGDKACRLSSGPSAVPACTTVLLQYSAAVKKKKEQQGHVCASLLTLHQHKLPFYG